MDMAAYKFIGMGITMIGVAIGAGYGISSVFSAWLSAIARNPSAEDKLKLPGFVGFAGTELVLLLGFVVAILIFIS